MHHCHSCPGCGKSLSLTAEEIQLLYKFAQTPFIGAARRIDDATPVYLEDTAFTPEEYGILFTLLEKKGLITIDFDRPLKNADYSLYTGYPILGSMALTARGQQVLDLLEVQGYTSE